MIRKHNDKHTPVQALKPALLALAIAQALAMQAATAASIEVTSSMDISANDTDCTLREAIATVNTGSAGTSGCVASGTDALGTNDTITFDSALAGNTITLNGSPLSITNNVSINPYEYNNTLRGLTIDANSASRVMDIDGAVVALNYLTLSGGSITGNGGGIYARNSSSVTLSGSTVSGNSAGAGGGIFAEGSPVTLSDSTVSGNSAAGPGGGIFTRNSSLTLSDSEVSGNSGYAGGGVYANGSSVTLSNSTVSGNTAYRGGGIDARGSSIVTLSDSTVSGNSAFYSFGGGIFAENTSSVTLSNSTVSGNSATNRGGGIYANVNSSITLSNSTVSGNTAGNSGGGISAEGSPVTLSSSTVSGNSAGRNGGGIYANSSSSVTLSNSTVSGNSAFHGGGIYAINSSSVTLSNSTVSGNTAGNRGGGIFAEGSPVTLSDSTVSGNSAAGGGGGVFTRNSSLTLSNSTVSGNSAGGGGGILANSSSVTLSNSTVSGNSASSLGGGIFAYTSSVTLSNSTVSDNTANSSGGGIFANSSSSVTLSNSTVSGNSASLGGGIYADSSSVTLSNSTVSGNSAEQRYGGGILAYSSSSVTLSNSTVSGNTALDGGGILALSSSSVTLSNSTVSGNTARRFGGGIQAHDESSITLSNSIVANSTGDDCLNNSDSTITAGLDSIIETNNCGTSAMQVDPNLGPLADNGGPTLTHALLPGSPAIRTVDNGGGMIDQRGFVAVDERDIGAYEFGAIDHVPLVNNRWTMVGLSTDAPSKTVADVFGATTPTALSPGDYNRTWVVYRRDETTESYLMMALGDSLEQGRGYWVFQLTGSDLEFAPDGADTPVVDQSTDPNCPSMSGCFEIDIEEGADRFTFISHPFTNRVSWNDVRIVVNGDTVCDPGQASNNNYLTDTFWNYYGGGYDPFSSDVPMPGGGVLEAYKGYWVLTSSGSEGTDVKLLIPKGPVSGDAPTCEAPPVSMTSIEGGSDESRSTGDVVAQDERIAVIPSEGGTSESRNLDGLFSTFHADAGVWRPRNTSVTSLPWWLSWVNVAQAAEDTTLKGGEWWVRLQAQTTEDGGLLDRYNYLGWYRDSDDGKDRRDLVELPAFGTPNLSIVFPHDDWVEDAGDYSTDIRQKKYWRLGDEWDFIVKSDKVGRDVTLSWEGYFNAKRFYRMRLVDVDSGKTVRTVRRGTLQTYTFTTQSTEHQFKWVYQARPKR